LLEARAGFPVTDARPREHVSVSHRKQLRKQNDSGQIFNELGRSEQLVTLPEPANTNNMKVDTRNNEVVITIPKKKTSS